MKTKNKTKTSAQLKKELDKVFSLWVRQTWANDEGMASCYTCGKVAHWKQLQNGHFIPRNILITRWDENNCRPQCVGCNMFGNGKILDFEDRLVRELGRKRVDELKASRFKILKIDSAWYLDKIEHYKNELNNPPR
jgi:hypothetical protein